MLLNTVEGGARMLRAPMQGSVTEDPMSHVGPGCPGGTRSPGPTSRCQADRALTQDTHLPKS